MTINRITTEHLRRMQGKDGLILQGCGGDPEEWLRGINEILTEQGILLDGTNFENIFTFEHDDVTCLLFPFEKDVKFDIGRLAVWRLNTHEIFYGKWMSDFVPNYLGGFIGPAPPEMEKPDCPLAGQNGNIFNLAGIASRTLCEYGQEEKAEEMKKRIVGSHSYEEALHIIGEYVNITVSRTETERPQPRPRSGR